MQREEVEELLKIMQKDFPYNDRPEPGSDDDFCRHAYENGYYKGWITMTMAVRAELRDDKYKALKRRPRS